MRHKIKQDIDYLLNFSADVDASFTLIKDHDIKKVCRCIDRLFGFEGVFNDQVVESFCLLNEDFDFSKDEIKERRKLEEDRIKEQNNEAFSANL